MWSFWTPARAFCPFGCGAGTRSSRCSTVPADGTSAKPCTAGPDRRDGFARPCPRDAVQRCRGCVRRRKTCRLCGPYQLYEQKIWKEVFQVKLCKALDGTSYIKPLERNVLFHAVAPVVSKTGLLQNKNAIAACTKRSCKQEKQSVPDGERPVVHGSQSHSSNIPSGHRSESSPHIPAGHCR